jgi:hypothetical protein
LHSRKVVGWFTGLALAVSHALVYYYFLPLSLGPRVVLQPWLMRQGYLLYEHIADEHPPLLYLLLSTGQPLASDGLVLAKIVLASLIGGITLLTYWAGQRTGGWLTGVCAALFCVLWSPIFEYGKLWHETLLAPVYTLILVQWRPPLSDGPNVRSSLVTGLLLGMALLIKQHALAVILGLILWHSFVSWYVHRPLYHVAVEITAMALAVFLPIAAFTIYHLLQAGTVENLAFWTITFNFLNNYRQFASLPPQISQFTRLVTAYLLLPVSIIDLWTSRDDVTVAWSRIGWALILLATSSLTAYPRFAMFHLQASLPILAWLSGTILARLLNVRDREACRQDSSRFLLSGLAFSVILLWTFQASVPYCQFLSGDEPQAIAEYTDLLPLAREIRRYVGPSDCIYIFPDDEATANLYYLTQCTPPRFWMPTSYPWFTLDTLQLKAIRSLEQTPPEWVIYFPGRWGIEQHGQEISTYIQHEYQLDAHLSWAKGEVQLLRRRPD